VFAAVAGEVTVVVVDHRDARADETGDGEDRDTGAEREGRIGVAHVVETTERLDIGGDLGGLPVPAAEDPEVDPVTARIWEQNRVLRWR
jgi:hypothetical protein